MSASVPSKYASLPKVELHVHVDGAWRLDTLQALSRQHGCPYPHDNKEQFRQVVTLPSPTSSLTDFLKVLDAINDILSTKESLERVVYEYCEDCAKQNVVYVELRFCPYLDTPGVASRCSGEEYCEGIFAGLERGQRNFGIKVRTILVFMRHVPGEFGMSTMLQWRENKRRGYVIYDRSSYHGNLGNLLVGWEASSTILEERVEDTMKLCMKYKDSWVVGVDMVGNESLPLDPRHVAGFRKAKKLGLHVTVHAAESGPASSVKQAVLEMGADRIGHGYRVLEDPAIYQLAKDKGLHFETCPMSSIFTKSSQFEDHAIQRFAKDGVSFSLSTGFPGIMSSTLNKEFHVTETEIGLTQHQIMKSVLCAAEATFLPLKERTELVDAVRGKLAKFDPTFKL